MAEKTIEIDLQDFPSEDLIEELNFRKLRDGDFLRKMARFDFEEIIRLLEYSGCPMDIIKELDDWNSEPIPDGHLWEQWCRGLGKVVASI